MGIAVALQYTNGLADNDFLINLLNALFVVGCFGAGIRGVSGTPSTRTGCSSAS